MFGEFSRHVHGTQRVLKAAVFSRRIDPAGALKLVDIAQPLHPRRVNDRFLGGFGLVLRYGELDVTVDGIRDQRGSFVFGIAELRHGLLDFKN